MVTMTKAAAEKEYETVHQLNAQMREFRAAQADEWGAVTGCEHRDGAAYSWYRDRQKDVLTAVAEFLNYLGRHRVISVSHQGGRVFVWYWYGLIPEEWPKEKTKETEHE